MDLLGTRRWSVIFCLTDELFPKEVKRRKHISNTRLLTGQISWWQHFPKIRNQTLLSFYHRIQTAVDTACSSIDAPQPDCFLCFFIKSHLWILGNKNVDFWQIGHWLPHSLPPGERKKGNIGSFRTSRSMCAFFQLTLLQAKQSADLC